MKSGVVGGTPAPVFKGKAKPCAIYADAFDIICCANFDISPKGDARYSLSRMRKGGAPAPVFKGKAKPCARYAIRGTVP